MKKSLFVKNKKGFTMVELIVSMTIFIIVVTLLVGMFVTASDLQLKSEATRETQQNTRMMIEQISRYAKEAKTVDITSSGSDITLELGIFIGGIEKKIIFKKTGDNLMTSGLANCAVDDCAALPINYTLNPGSILVTEFTPEVIPGIPGMLELKIKSRDNPDFLGTSGFARDEIELETTVSLRGQELN